MSLTDTSNSSRRVRSLINWIAYVWISCKFHFAIAYTSKKMSGWRAEEMHLYPQGGHAIMKGGFGADRTEPVASSRRAPGLCAIAEAGS